MFPSFVLNSAYSHSYSIVVLSSNLDPDSSFNMATTIQKLLRKPLQQGIFPYLKNENQLSLLPPLLQHQPNLDTLPQNHNLCNLKTGIDSKRIPTSLFQKNAVMDSGFHVFPSFSFEFFLDPKLSPGFHRTEVLKAQKWDLDDSQVMWADSVKKKRKKKMNKHKLRKLRKRIRGYN